MPNLVRAPQMIDDKLGVTLDRQVSNSVWTGLDLLQTCNQSEILGDVVRAVISHVVSPFDDCPPIFIVDHDIPTATFSGVGLACTVEAERG